MFNQILASRFARGTWAAGFIILVVVLAACGGSNQQASPSPTPVNTVYLDLSNPTQQPLAAGGGCSPPSGWLIYTVAAGDTIGTIADQFGVTPDQLAVANCLTNTNLIYVGQPVYVPPQPGVVANLATPIPTPIVWGATPAALAGVTPLATSATCPPPYGWVPYIVVGGDTLDIIASTVGITSDQLATANCLTSADLIYVGQVLYVPTQPGGSGGGVAVAAVPANAPVVLLMNGDLSTWSSADGLIQISTWGYNERPVLAPDGVRIAYNSWADITVGAARSGQPLVGFIPSNTWVWNLEAGEAFPVSVQPDNASFGVQGVPNQAIMRSAPAWSPDGNALAWTEILLPGYVRRLVVYDFTTQTASVIVSELPTPFADAGTWAIAEVTWGATGLALLNGAYNQQSQDFEQFVYIYDRNGGLIITALVGRAQNDLVVQIVWLTYGGQEYLGLLYETGSWLLVDPRTQTALAAPAAPELYSASSPSNSAALVISAVDSNRRPVWAVIDGGRQRTTPLNVSASLAQVSIDPTGQAVAMMSGSLLIWQNGQLTSVPDTEELPENLPTGYTTGMRGLVWGPTAWRIGAGQPPAVAVPAATLPTACPLPPRLAVGQQGHVIPGDANALRSQPGTGSNSQVLGQIPSGGYFVVLGGPQCVDGYYWWQVNYNGAIGWTAEGIGSAYWLEPG